MRGDRCSTAPSDQLTGSGLFIRTEKVIKWIFCVAVFVFFSIWFFRIHPLQIFDTDDWKYACYHREALPIWGKLESHTCSARSPDADCQYVWGLCDLSNIWGFLWLFFHGIFVYSFCCGDCFDGVNEKIPAVKNMHTKYCKSVDSFFPGMPFLGYAV